MKKMITIRVTEVERAQYHLIARQNGFGSLNSLISFLLSCFASGKLSIIVDEKNIKKTLDT